MAAAAGVVLVVVVLLVAAHVVAGLLGRSLLDAVQRSPDREH